MKHLGHHLEQLALHAIPRDAFTSDSENESAASGASGRSSESSEGKDKLDLAPSPNMEDSEREASTSPEHTDKSITSDRQKVKFTDALGRRFAFPWNMCKSWTGMKGLINEAFGNIEHLREHVRLEHYDLIGPDGEFILRQVWDTLIQPGWEINMIMWPLPTYQACIPCRRDKVRCDLGTVDDPHDPPCARCLRESRDCFFNSTGNEDLDLNPDDGAPPVPSSDVETYPADDDNAYANLRTAKSFADLRSYTPSPTTSTASFPAEIKDAPPVPSIDVESREDSLKRNSRSQDEEQERSINSNKRTPAFPKIHRKYIDEATLEYYNIPYEIHKDDGNFFILLRAMDSHEMDFLFEDTRKLRAGEIVATRRPRQFTDEELKEQYGIHLATRSETDVTSWADLDEDEDDWVPETVEWMDGTKSSLTREAAPVFQSETGEASPSSASNELIPADYIYWEEDFVDHYRLRKVDFLRFLRAKFGAYREEYFRIGVGLAATYSR